MVRFSKFEILNRSTQKVTSNQEGYIEELTRLSQCLNAKTGFVHFWSVYQSFLYWIFMFQIEHYQKILEGQCLNSIRLTAPLYILLASNYQSVKIFKTVCDRRSRGRVFIPYWSKVNMYIHAPCRLKIRFWCHIENFTIYVKDKSIKLKWNEMFCLQEFRNKGTVKPRNI